jgi:hypothetical protein
MIAHLFHAPLGESETAVGVGTVGSSEAIMLAGLAFKRRWQNKRKAEGKPFDKPNIVTGANVQVMIRLPKVISYNKNCESALINRYHTTCLDRYRFAGRSSRGTSRWSSGR